MILVEPKKKIQIDTNYAIDSLYEPEEDYDVEFSDEYGDFDYFAKAEAEDNSSPLH